MFSGGSGTFTVLNTFRAEAYFYRFMLSEQDHFYRRFSAVFLPKQKNRLRRVSRRTGRRTATHTVHSGAMHEAFGALGAAGFAAAACEGSAMRTQSSESPSSSETASRRSSASRSAHVLSPMNSTSSESTLLLAPAPYAAAANLLVSGYLAARNAASFA